MSLTIIAALIAVAAFAGWSFECYKIGGDTRIASYEQKLKAADDALVEAGKKLQDEAANHISDMSSAYSAGEAAATVTNKTYIVKGQTDAAKYPVFSNPACVLPDDSLRNLNGARAGLQPAADPGGAAAALPATGAAGGRKDGDAVPAVAQGPGTLVRVHPPTSATSASSEVPRLGVHPKPKVIAE